MAKNIGLTGSNQHQITLTIDDFIFCTNSYLKTLKFKHKERHRLNW